MQEAITLEEFNGPLDLLLQLIEKDELEITKIAIAEVTEQFLEYLEKVEERHPEEMADFLVVATKLLLMKSQALLPYLYIEQEEEPGNLEAQLKMYKKYYEATKGIQELFEAGHMLHAKKEYKQVDVVFAPPATVGPNELRQFFVDVLERLEPVVRIPKTALLKVVTLREKFNQIQELLQNHVELKFQELIVDSNDRGEVVVTFLALLELVKTHHIIVRQDRPLADIIIQKMV